MKEKEIQKLYNSMTNVREEYIEEAREAETIKKHPIWIRRGVPAACLCLAAIAIFIVTNLFASSPEKDQDANEGQILTADIRHPENDQDKVIGTADASPDGDPKEYSVAREGETTDDVKTAAQDPTEQDPVELDQEMGGWYLMPDNGEFIDWSQVKTMISAYGDMDDGIEDGIEDGIAVCYMAPDNGTYSYSMPLKKAMEEYGDTVKYRVVVDVFSDNQILDADSEAVEKERKRLGKLDYIVSFEQYRHYGVITNSYFTLHAEQEQLINFAANEDYGYMLWLYDERVR